MSKKRVVWLVLILVLLLPLAYLAFRAVYSAVRRSQLYAAGRAAAAAGQWPAAFAAFRELVALDPGSREAREQLDEAVQQTLPLVPLPNAAVEAQLLRWLAATGDETGLVEALDRSAMRIPAGEFRRGSDADPPDERPQQLVYLDAFTIDRYEVSNAQYRRFLLASGRPAPPYWSGGTYPPGQADSPVVGVSWVDADAYCAWAGRRLPTEAEWEKACRGTAGRIYPWGETWDSRRANVDLSTEGTRPTPWPGARDDAWALLQASPTGSGRGLRPVGSYPDGVSPYGVLDLAGNASEWVADWYNWQGYEALPVRNPLGTAPQWNHVLRGSSWYEPYGSAGQAQERSRCAARNSSHTAYDPRVGFRCAHAVP